MHKETFQSIIKDSFSEDEKKADKIYMDVQENLTTMIDEYNSMYDDTDYEPITLAKEDIQNLLIESDVSEEITAKIQKSYLENFGDDIPLAENLIDAKALKANMQRKKEVNLEKQVEILQTRLEQVTQEVAVASVTPLAEEVKDDNITPIYDVILQVKPEKVSQIKSQIIDGQKCIVIPINENEKSSVNGLLDSI